MKVRVAQSVQDTYPVRAGATLANSAMAQGPGGGFS